MAAKFALILILVLGSGFFSACEISLFGLSKSKLKLMTDNKEKNIDLINKLLSEKDLLLSTILLGNNITNISAASVATLLFVELLGQSYGPLSSTVFMTILLLCLGAVLPKSIATKMPDKVAKLIIKPLYLITKILWPLAYPLNKVLKRVTKKLDEGTDSTITSDEVKAMADMSKETGGIKEETSEFIKGIIDFSTTKVKDIMTPNIHVRSITLDATIDDVRSHLKDGLSHLPVFDPKTQKCAGMLHTRNLVYEDNVTELDIEKYLSEVFYVYETVTIKDLLLLFQENRRQIALVNDEYGAIVGIVTMEDIMESMVGDLYDEFDKRESKIVSLGTDTYVVKGSVKLAVLNKHIGSSFESPDSSTIGGLTLEMMSGHLEVNKTVEVASFELKTLKIGDNRIEEVRIKRLPEPEVEE